jgi:hypothetical protein
LRPSFETLALQAPQDEVSAGMTAKPHEHVTQPSSSSSNASPQLPEGPESSLARPEGQVEIV